MYEYLFDGDLLLEETLNRRNFNSHFGLDCTQITKYFYNDKNDIVKEIMDFIHLDPSRGDSSQEIIVYNYKYDSDNKVLSLEKLLDNILIKYTTFEYIDDLLVKKSIYNENLNISYETIIYNYENKNLLYETIYSEDIVSYYVYYLNDGMSKKYLNPLKKESNWRLSKNSINSTNPELTVMIQVDVLEKILTPIILEEILNYILHLFPKI